MASRLKRIVSRSSDSAPAESQAAGEPIDPNVLLPQIRDGLATLKESQIELNKREHELIAEASQLYEQLKVTAHELATIRQHQATTSEQVDKLLDALHLLEHKRIGNPAPDHSDTARSETLVVQPKV